MNLDERKVGDCVRHADFLIPEDFQTAEVPTILAILTYGRIVEIHPPFVDVQPIPTSNPVANQLNAQVSFAEARITLESTSGERCVVPLSGTQKISVLELLAVASASPEDIK